MKPRPEACLVMRNVVVAGKRTSVRLEPVMWRALQEIAKYQNKAVHELVTEIDHLQLASSLTSAIRVYIVDFYRSVTPQVQAPSERSAAASEASDPLPLLATRPASPRAN